MIPLAIIGLGRIGAGNVGLAGDLPLSHLAAVRACGGFGLAGLVDPDPPARAAAVAAHPDVPADLVKADISEIGAVEGGVVVLAVPVAVRAALLPEVLIRRPRVVIVEKPLATDLPSARAQVAAIERAGAVLRVNFHRRFDPRHRRWRAAAPRRPRLATLRYGKGLHNYASHMIDLMLDWYGPIERVAALASSPSAAGDPALSFSCRMAAGFDAVFLGMDDLAYDQFEIDFFGSDSRLEMRAGGADIRRHAPVAGLHYRGYSHLAETEGARDIGPVGGFVELYRAVHDHLLNGAPLAGCDGAAALANMAVIDAALRSAALGGAALAPEYALPRAA